MPSISTARHFVTAAFCHSHKPTASETGDDTAPRVRTGEPNLQPACISQVDIAVAIVVECDTIGCRGYADSAETLHEIQIINKAGAAVFVNIAAWR